MVMVLLSMCLASPAGAQAALDPCLVGTWEAPIATTPWPYTGRLTLNIPDAAGGTATIAVNAAKVPEGESLVIPVNGAPGAEPYAVEAASTPENAAGSIAFTPMATDAGYNNFLLLNVAPTFGSNYSCTEGSLNLRVTLDIETGLVLNANAFTRSGPGPQPMTLQVVNQGTGTGTVTSSPSGIGCPPACSASYWPGTPVTLTAARISAAFIGWGGACASSHTFECQMTMGASEVVNATFGHELAVTTTGAGTVAGNATDPTPPGFPSPPTIDCSVCYAYFAQAATLLAIPAHGYRFLGWTGACYGPRDTCPLPMTNKSSVTAIFAADQRRLPDLTGTQRRSFLHRRYAQTTMRPGDILWRGETEIRPGVGRHSDEGYFGFQEPTTSAKAKTLYNALIWGNRADCVQEYLVVKRVTGYVGRVAGGSGTQVLAATMHGVLTIPQLLSRGMIRTVGPCVALPPG